MRKNVVLTLTGSDRVGIVDSVTEVLVKYDGNVETSRMARLGGEFAMLMLVSIPQEQSENFKHGVKSLEELGFQVATKQTELSYEQKYVGWLPYQIEVHGADHEGIVHKVAHYLTERGINIESMDTGIVPAPMSGTLFFSMNAVVLVPPSLPHKDWQGDLDDVADHLNVEIKISAYKGK
ncbi:MAG: transcriptional regulator [Chloroflexi bacterium]|nr:transcriptional regulator [Chloroflexota bacterium]